MSVLRKPDVQAKFFLHYLGVQSDFGELQLDDDDPRHATVKRHNPRKYRPVLVFLDSEGKEVARHTGKLEKDEALLLDRFVHGRHYLKMDLQKFRATGG